MTGKATDTLGNSIGSIVLGLIQILVAVAIGFGGMLLGQNRGAPPPAGMAEVLLITSVLVAVMGTTLVAAGIMALLGRRRYREWRAANTPRRSRRRPPRRRPEYLDEDEE